MKGPKADAWTLRGSGSRLEAMLALQLRAAGLPEPVRQFKPLLRRRYRVDFYWPESLLAVEVQGAVWTQGRHTRGAGYIADCERLNLLQLAGLRVLYVTERHIRSGQALAWIERALAPREVQ